MPPVASLSQVTDNGAINLQSTITRLVNWCSCFIKCTNCKKRNKVISNSSLPPGWEYLESYDRSIRVLHHIPTGSSLESHDLIPVIKDPRHKLISNCQQYLELCTTTNVFETTDEQAAPAEKPTPSEGVDNKGFCVDNIDEIMESDFDGIKKNPSAIRPLLLFLHGLGGSADVWKSQTDFFVSCGFEVVAFDMLGHGFSSAPYKAKCYTFRKLLCDALNVFDKYVDTTRKCIVIGHSYGASFSAAIAKYRSSQVVLLVMVSSGGPAPLIPRNSKLHYSTCLLNCIKPLLFCGFHREIFYTPRGKQLKFTDAYDIPRYVLSNILKGQYWPEGDIIFHKRISIPTLLVYGLKDQLVNLVEECDMERTIPRAHLELIPSAGHMVMLESPQELNRLISNFISKWTK